MNREVEKFWQRNNTPIRLMMQKAWKHGVKPKQVEAAAHIVYEEVQELIENVPEIKLGLNGKHLEKIILLRNHLKPNVLGWRVFQVAKFVKLHEETGEPVIEKKNIWQKIKSFNWRIDPWQ